MDQLPSNSPIRWRAILPVPLHDAAYLTIIGADLVTASLLITGVFHVARDRRDEVHAFHRSKSLWVAGLALGFLLYQGGFVAIAREWFGMWQAQHWHGVESAFRIAVTLLGILIFIALKDDEWV
jgi:predicted small integral membrane protein